LVAFFRGGSVRGGSFTAIQMYDHWCAKNKQIEELRR